LGVSAIDGPDSIPYRRIHASISVYKSSRSAPTVGKIKAISAGGLQESGLIGDEL
jgi:hypothetical protein